MHHLTERRYKRTEDRGEQLAMEIMSGISTLAAEKDEIETILKEIRDFDLPISPKSAVVVMRAKAKLALEKMAAKRMREEAT